MGALCIKLCIMYSMSNGRIADKGHDIQHITDDTHLVDGIWIFWDVKDNSCGPSLNSSLRLWGQQKKVILLHLKVQNHI